MFIVCQARLFEVENIGQNSYDVSNLNKGVYTVLAIDKEGNNLSRKNIETIIISKFSSKGLYIIKYSPFLFPFVGFN